MTKRKLIIQNLLFFVCLKIVCLFSTLKPLSSEFGYIRETSEILNFVWH